MSDYPDILVLDLDTKEHKFKNFIDSTYTHETKRGWHLFFKNSFNLKSKIIKHSEKYDVLVGNNWCFYNYQDKSVASYKEYNNLPIVPLPQEIWDDFKPKAIDWGENAVEYRIKPLADELYTTIDKYRKEHGVSASSELAYYISFLIIGYSKDINFHIAMIQYFIDKNFHINKKHLQEKYISRNIIKITNIVLEESRVNFRFLDEFRIVHTADKQMHLDLINDEFVAKVYLSNITLDSVDIKHLNLFRIYEKAEFLPQYKDRFIGTTYNTFAGFIEAINKDDSHIIFLDFLREVICANNEQHYEYIIKYIAHMVQKPEEKPDVAIVLSSPSKGIGKDTFHELLGKLLANGGYINLTDEELFGRFKSRLKHMLLAVAEEMVYGGYNKEDSTLKRFITRHSIPIEEKGGSTVEYNNYVRLIITSNSDKPVKATDGERRYFILKPLAKYKGNFEYWNNLYSSFNPSQVLYYFTNEVNIVNFNPRDIPQSEELQHLIDINKSIIDEMLDNWWSSIENNDFVNFVDLFLDYEYLDKYLTAKKLATKIFHKFGKEHFIATTLKTSRGYKIKK